MQRRLLKSAPLRSAAAAEGQLRRRRLSTVAAAAGRCSGTLVFKAAALQRLPVLLVPPSSPSTNPSQQQQPRAPIIPQLQRHQQRRGLASSSSSSPPSPIKPPTAATAAAAAAVSDAPPAPTPAAAATAAAAAAEEQAKQAPVEGFGGDGQEAAFPWREAPRPISRWEVLWKFVREFLPQAYVRGLLFTSVGNTMINAPPEDVPVLLLRSTRFAFIQAVRSIFESSSSAAAANTSPTDKDGQEEQAKATVVCKTPPPTWEYTKDENTAIASGEHELGYPPLADMVDEQLAALYEGSVARLAASGRSVRLELEKVVPLTVADVQLIIGPPRGTPLPAGATIHKRFGVTTVLVPTSNPGNDEDMGVGSWGGILSHHHMYPGRVAPNYHYIFQMLMVFRCRELFAVTHAQTGELLQGWTEPRDVDHWVKFEVGFDMHGHLARDWLIVDIDGWLGGNEYPVGVSDEAGNVTSSTTTTGAGGEAGGAERRKDE